MTEGYTCRCCGQYHNEIAMSYGTDMPVYVQSMDAHERAKRVKLNDFICVIDDEHCFIRGNIIIPVKDSEDDFFWGVWSTLSQKNFKLAVDNWDVEGREKILEPAFGYLSTPLPLYPDTMNLNMLTHTLPVGSLPFFELEPTNHPLALEQRFGITMARVHEINKVMNG